MNQLRIDPLLKYPVVVAKGRDARPQQWQAEQTPPANPIDCPFCGGNEHATRHETLVLPQGLQRRPDQSPWQVRVVPNVYPSLAPIPAGQAAELAQWPMIDSRLGHGYADTMAADDDGFPEGIHYLSETAWGSQEVIIESPEHALSLTELPLENARWTFQAYQQRLNAIREQGVCRYVQLFKNKGPAAGASLEHTHSQLMATRDVPWLIGSELTASEAYHRRRNNSYWEELIQNELQLDERIVHADDQVVALCPYASRVPMEVWVFPRRRQADFGKAQLALLDQVAWAVRSVLAAIESSLKFPSYNYLIHTTPFDTLDEDHYHWHVEILPRVTVRAGFEWGTGWYVNPLPPEDAAQTLRKLL